MLSRPRSRRWLIPVASTIILVVSTAVPAGAAPPPAPAFAPRWASAVAHDISPTLRSLAAAYRGPTGDPTKTETRRANSAPKL